MIVTATPASVTGVILAGGCARRIGGQDKGLLSLLERPLIEYVLEALRPELTQVMISANQIVSAIAWRCGRSAGSLCNPARSDRAECRAYS